jgi:two-component sensor histidine kinase
MKKIDWPRWRTLAARKEMRPAWLVACLSFAATVLFWAFARGEDQLAAQATFDAMTQRFVAEVEQTVTGYEQVLRAGRGLLNTRLEVTKDDWREFADALEIAERYPGTRGVGYTVMIASKDLEAHNTAMRAVYGPQYKVHPEGPRDIYSAIIFLEPQDERNRRAVGFDMFAEATRKAAMEHARDSGEIAATGKVTLVQEGTDNAQAGVLLYLPVYSDASTPASEDERRASLRGFVYSPLRMGDFIGGLATGSLESLEELMRIELFDGDPEVSGQLLFDSMPGVGKTKTSVGGFKNIASFDQNGRSWVLRFTALPKFDESTGSYTTWIVLAIGSALSFLLSALAASLALRHIQEAEANTQMALLTRELSHRVKNTLAIVQSIANRSLSNERTISEGREVFTKRLHALARAHTFLLNSGWSGADLKELVIAELSAFGARASVRGPEVRLTPQIAQTFALVVHELATNAVKHGSLSVDEGRVIVAWEIAKRENGRIFIFNWREMGGPPVSDPKRNGFGQTLLRQVLVHGSTSEPEIVFGEAGFSYRYEAPLSGIMAPDPAGEGDDDAARSPAL